MALHNTQFQPPLAVASGGSATITQTVLNIVDNSTNPPTPANVLLTITTPPAHGTITVSGVAASHFTQQNVNDGLVVYHNDGSAPATDSFGYLATVTTTPGVATPYTPHFTAQYASGPSQVGGVYCATALVGTTAPPTLTGGAAVTGGSGVATSLSAPITVSNPNTVVVVAVWTIWSTLTTVTSLVCPSLTFTHIGGGTITTTDSIGTGYSDVEFWWAPAASPFTSTITANLSGSMAVSQIVIGYWLFNGVNSVSSPWDTNASNFNVLQTATLPATMTLTPNAADGRVLPVFYEVVGGDLIGGTNFPPVQGYTFTPLEGGTRGRLNSHIRYVLTGTFDLAITTPALTLFTAADMFFSPTPGLVDLSSGVTRRKFATAAAAPQWLGTDATLPLGVRPSVYLQAFPGNADAFASNALGVGGAFAISNGPLALADDDPACSTYQIDIAAGPETDPQVRLYISDDGGRTWQLVVRPRSMGKIGEYLTRLRWLKLGHARTRMMRLEMSDRVRKNIVGIYVDTKEGMS